MSTLSPTACLELTARSLLLSFGLDQVLTDFLIRSVIGAAAVLAAITFVGVRSTRRATLNPEAEKADGQRYPTLVSRIFAR
jgi:hypothetical protein